MPRFKTYCPICDTALLVQDDMKPGEGLPSAKFHAKAHKMTPQAFERVMLSAAKDNSLIYSKLK